MAITSSQSEIGIGSIQTQKSENFQYSFTFSSNKYNMFWWTSPKSSLGILHFWYIKNIDSLFVHVNSCNQRQAARICYKTDSDDSASEDISDVDEYESDCGVVELKSQTRTVERAIARRTGIIGGEIKKKVFVRFS